MEGENESQNSENDLVVYIFPFLQAIEPVRKHHVVSLYLLTCHNKK